MLTTALKLSCSCIVTCVFAFSASPSMRGSTPLDVAASSVMDNNGLALALEEPDLDKVSVYSIASWSPE